MCESGLGDRSGPADEEGAVEFLFVESFAQKNRENE